VEHAELLEAAAARAADSAAAAAAEQRGLVERGGTLAEELSGAQELSEGVARVKERLAEVEAVAEKALSIEKGGGGGGGSGGGASKKKKETKTI